MGLLVVVGGLVAAGTLLGPAEAGEPYPGSVATTCNGAALNNPAEGSPARVRFGVSVDGDGAPAGRVVFVYQRVKDDTVTNNFRRDYQGEGATRYELRGVPAGRYVVSARFDSRPRDSVYADCSTSFRQRVRPAS